MANESNSRQALWIAIGQFCAYAIGIVSPMILSRYFDKGDYGTYKQVMYVYNTLLTVFTLGLPRAYSYFIPRVSLGESRDVVKKITRVFVLLGALFSVILLFGSSMISSLLNNPDLDYAIKLFSPTPLFLLPVAGLDCILVSYKKSQYVALYSVLTKVFTLLCIVMPVILFGGNYIHAIIGFDIASFLSFLLALYLRNLPTRNINIIKTTIRYKEVFKFSIPLLIASLWMMLYNSANQFFISRYYGNETFAEFSNGFFDFPLIPMVINSVATVLLPVFSGLVINNSEHIKNVWINALTKSFKITYPIIVYCIAFAPVVMVCFYGHQYEASAIYFIIKNVGALFTVIPFYPVLLALGKTKQYSSIHMTLALIIYPLEYLVVIAGMPAFMIGVVYVVCYILGVYLQFYVTSKAIGISFRQLIPIKSILKVLFSTVASSVIPLFILLSFPSMNEFILLFLTLALYLLTYYIICFITHVSYKDIVSSYVSGDRFRNALRYIP